MIKRDDDKEIKGDREMDKEKSRNDVRSVSVSSLINSFMMMWCRFFFFFSMTFLRLSVSLFSRVYDVWLSGNLFVFVCFYQLSV